MISKVMLIVVTVWLASCGAQSPENSAGTAIVGQRWVLSEPSRLNFVSVKNNAVAEVHRFRELSGVFESDGRFSLQVNLASVDTAIPIRDQRMKELLFEVEKNPYATISGVLNPLTQTALTEAAGAAATVDLAAELRLGELVTPLNVQVLVGSSDAGLRVSTAAPFVLSVNQLGLSAGVEALRDIAGLQSISPAVPVTFHLFFKRDN